MHLLDSVKKLKAGKRGPSAPHEKSPGSRGGRRTQKSVFRSRKSARKRLRKKTLSALKIKG